MLNNLQEEFQSAYRTGFSTETALIKIMDYILKALDCMSFTALKMINMFSALTLQIIIFYWTDFQHALVLQTTYLI